MGDASSIPGEVENLAESFADSGHEGWVEAGYRALIAAAVVDRPELIDQ
ncbi:MAG: hypothetical protein HY652_01250 [Acidobacteria bacterium]|nr:hypothetical protein [Acidobacteriota bacterium]